MKGDGGGGGGGAGEQQQRVPLRTVLQNFVNHVENLEQRRLRGDDQFEKEFQELKAFSESLKRSPQYTCQQGEKDVNRKKNRYKDILPFDHTRVILSDYGGVPGSDYTNASYIKGASGSAAYITCQGPLPNTVVDFWRMVVECEVQVIVMACNEQESGKHKCENYWAEKEGEEKQFGKVTVSLVKARQVCPDFLVRTMQIRYSNDEGKFEERTVCQFHYSTWPDHGVPPMVRPLLDMVRLVRDCQASETLPVLVHCSAGCGRTGTICAIDYVWGLLRTGKLTESFSLSALVCDMRRQRVAMVQTKEQYILVHRAVRELFEEQLKIINAHPYANVDQEGLPLMDKIDPLYESLDSLREEEKVDQKEKEGSEASDESDPQSRPLPKPPPNYTNIPLALVRDKAPPLPKKNHRKDPVTAAVSKLEKEVENLNAKQRSFQPVSASPSPLQSSSDSLELSSNSGSLQKRRHRLFNFSIGDKSESHSEPSSSRASPIRNALLRKPSIVRLKAFFEKPSSAECWPKQANQSTFYVPATPPAKKPSLLIKRSKSVKIHWSGRSFQAVASDESKPVVESNPLPYLGLETRGGPRKPVVPPRQKSMDVREEVAVGGHQYANVKTIHGSHPSLGDAPEPKPVTSSALTRSRSCTWQLPDETRSPPSYSEATKARNLSALYAKVVPRNRRGQNHPRPSSLVVSPSGSHDIADMPRKMTAAASLGVRERRHSFRQAVCKEADVRKRRDYEAIWPQVVDKACQTTSEEEEESGGKEDRELRDTKKAVESLLEEMKRGRQKLSEAHNHLPDGHAKLEHVDNYAKIERRVDQAKAERIGDHPKVERRNNHAKVESCDDHSKSESKDDHVKVGRHDDRPLGNHVGERREDHVSRDRCDDRIIRNYSGERQNPQPANHPSVRRDDRPNVIHPVERLVVKLPPERCEDRPVTSQPSERRDDRPIVNHSCDRHDRPKNNLPVERRDEHSAANHRTVGSPHHTPLHKYEVVVTENSFSPKMAVTSPYVVLPKVPPPPLAKPSVSSEPVQRRIHASRDDLDLRPQAPPRIKRNSSVVVMRHSLIDASDSGGASGGLVLSVWGSPPPATDSPPSPPGVDLDRVAQTMQGKERMRVAPPPPPVISPIPTVQAPPPTSPKPLVRALGMFQATAANIKSRFRSPPNQQSQRAREMAATSPSTHVVTPHRRVADLQRDVVTPRRKQQYL